MYEWLAPKPITVPPALRAFVGGHPLIAETLARRGITTAEAAQAFMDPRAVSPASALDFPDMERAVTRIEEAIRKGERICVWGDFDVDGQTATTLLVTTLRELGADVIHHIPVREIESHGVNVPQLTRVIDLGAQLLLTCDTGIDAYESIAYANDRGVSFIITDHHELPEGALPPAYAIINPHLLPNTHTLATLPGVGVAYKLAEALYARAGRPEAAHQYLDLVALGIVADVAQITGDTRYLLQLGLSALRETSRLGLQEMFKLAQVLPAQINEETIGFVIGPRLNALGRLDDANIIVDFLSTSDQAQARILAEQLEKLNNDRRRLCADVETAAEAEIAHNPSLLEYEALVLAHSQWPTGVVGIVASRLAERYNRPTVLLSAPANEVARGSARSVPGCNITEAIATQRTLLERFGGHAQAAGVALAQDNIPTFRRGLSRAVKEQRGTASSEQPLQIDGIVPFADLSLALVDDLERLAPFGAGNPPLTLATRNVRAQSVNQIGRNGDHLAITIEDGSGTPQRVIWWRAQQEDVPAETFDLAYTVRANTFRGERRLQIEWLDARLVQAPLPAALQPTEIPHRVIEDYRREPHPQVLLTPWLTREGTQIWAEGNTYDGAKTRSQLESGSVLILWSIPPGPEELATALAIVSPHEVAVFSNDPDLDTQNKFIKRLAGLINYALNHKEGKISVAALAAAMAHRKKTVRLGLAWMAAYGALTIVHDAGNIITVTHNGTQDPSALAQLTVELQAMLEETAAYRRHFARTGVEILL
ncbi:MAG: single-stranded-DNA-specific exonuclease RecJ [Anaerolineae bacterium]|nr:single-stranded-DNA-specific exonuclease RecJ [Anaerolineae bacterium]